MVVWSVSSAVLGIAPSPALTQSLGELGLEHYKLPFLVHVAHEVFDTQVGLVWLVVLFVCGFYCCW
jgi:hypothetical protein